MKNYYLAHFSIRKDQSVHASFGFFNITHLFIFKVINHSKNRDQSETVDYFKNMAVKTWLLASVFCGYAGREPEELEENGKKEYNIKWYRFEP